MLTRKTKLLYVMHIDWYWIKQRPQFLAEKLATYYDLLVIYPFNYRRKNLQKRNIPSEIKISPLFSIPKEKYFYPVKLLNLLFKKLYVSMVSIFFSPDCIWVSHPTMYRYMGRSKARLVYECMDDYVSMAESPESAREILDAEAKIIARADHVIVTSDHLKNVLMERHPNTNPDHIHVIRNGFDGKIIEPEDRPKSDDIFRIGYVGTISHWFDWPLIEASLRDFPNIEYHLIGPVTADANPVQHPRVRYYGTVEHDRLYETVRDFDCMIMPFVLNDIVKSVDPVKLYEYINYNKNILCVRYDEVLRFEPLVYFYTHYDEYCGKLKWMIEQDGVLKYTDIKRREFLIHSSWARRAASIMEIITDSSGKGAK